MFFTFRSTDLALLICGVIYLIEIRDEVPLCDQEAFPSIQHDQGQGRSSLRDIRQHIVALRETQRTRCTYPGRYNNTHWKPEGFSDRRQLPYLSQG